MGGEDAKIAPYQRNETSGSQTLMKKLVMNETKLSPARENFIANSMSDILKALASYENGRFAIGYNVHYYVTEMDNDPNIKILSVDGVYPGNDTIASGTYPLLMIFTRSSVKARRKIAPNGACSVGCKAPKGRCL